MKNQDASSRMSHLRVTLMAAVCAALLCAPLRVQAAESGTWVNGITEASNDVTLSAPTAGIISKLL